MAQVTDSKELWRQIPPEEKIELLSRAHSVGVFAALIAILCGGTMAVGLHMKWFLWGPIIASPLIFQIAAGRAWRNSRPRMMLTYLGARSAARRFAFTAKAKDLTLKLMFKGTMEEVFDKEQIQEALEATIEQTKETAVWVALFGDAVVMLSERPGGAEAEFAQAITDKLEVEVKNSDAGDYGEGKEVYLGYSSKNLGTRKVKLTSKYPAAMVVFEKALMQRHGEVKNRKVEIPALPDAGADDDQY